MSIFQRLRAEVEPDIGEDLSDCPLWERKRFSWLTTWCEIWEPGFSVRPAIKCLLPRTRKGTGSFREGEKQLSLVILDLIMPVMGGKECLKELLKIDPQMKVLIASGFSADASTDETLELGAKAFVSKPFRFEELLRQVRKTLDDR
jgi:CheY-like chemotaxis protein